MNISSEFKFDDLQGLLRYGYGKLTDTCFLLLDISDAEAAKKWLSTAPVSNAIKADTPPDNALQIAFSCEGLRLMGVKDTVIEGFSDEFIVGMSGDESRSRRLGDIAVNAPENWNWGGKSGQVPHLLLLLYARQGEIQSWRKTVEGGEFSQAFSVLQQLPTQDLGGIEPFGFKDGISQPTIDWGFKQTTDSHERSRFSNYIAVGEVVLGYPNEYGLYTTRPLIDPEKDKHAEALPDSIDDPGLKDFGRNGTYLVFRQLGQDVPGFWQFMDKATDEATDKREKQEKREQLAASMVGRKLDGSPIVEQKFDVKIPGITNYSETADNHFTFDDDPAGQKCPVGAHIRRSNPRTGDFPAGFTGFISRLTRMFGFGQKYLEEDLIASTRFHRLLRRGRVYGSILSPEQAIKGDTENTERGLQFICLVANISRQFEFVQNAWSMSNKFAGVQNESDPLLGHREPLRSGEATDEFNHPDPNGPVQKTCHLPQFVTVKGGGYFFMPGLSAIKYIAAIPVNKGDK